MNPTRIGGTGLPMTGNEKVLHFVDSGIQEILLFKEGDGSISLTLDEMWQFNSNDEARYHEGLVGIPMAFSRNKGHVLILGGGDALAVRDALKYKGVERVVLCELDPEMVRMSAENPVMREINGDSLCDPRVSVCVEDAQDYLKRCSGLFDVIVVDFPDPTTFDLAELFKAPLYKSVENRLAPGGVVSVQSSAPSVPGDFIRIRQELGKAFRNVAPYTIPMPNMGIAGMHLASQDPLLQKRSLPASFRWLRQGKMERAFGDGNAAMTKIIERQKAKQARKRAFSR